MPAPGPVRKGAILIFAGVVAGILLVLAGQVVVISGTKASFTFVPVSAAPPAAGTTTTATTAAGPATTGTR